MSNNPPLGSELHGYYSMHLGGRFEAAGLRVQLHHNQTPGIHFKVQPPDEYKAAILKGLEDGLKFRFPEFPTSGAIWITEITVHEIDSCERAFYRVGRMVIDQAFSLTESRQP